MGNEFDNNILILQRWLRLFALVIVSSTICVLFYPFLEFSGHKFTELTSRMQYPVGILIIWFFITTFLWFVLIRLGGFRIQDVWSITSLRYPPAWIFAFIATIIYLVVTPIVWSIPKSNEISAQLFFIVLSFTPGIVAAYLLKMLLSKWNIKSSIESKYSPIKNIDESLVSLIHKPDAFIQWLNEEKPIQKPSEDLFDLSIFARRVTEMLQKSPLKTIALVGDYGCGKSSILKLVEYFINNPDKLPTYSDSGRSEKPFYAKDIITCQVCGWGLHKGAASEHILRSAIAKLSEHVDCLGLTGIPSQYRLALSHSGSMWGKAFATLLGSSQDPLEILRQVDTVLACIKKRLIIYLEDLDRNILDKVYWNEIVSLLDRLKDLDNISFVLAINQDLKHDSALFRISEHIEFVTILPRKQLIDSIRTFRDICLDLDSKDVYCRSRDEMDQHLGLKRELQEYDIADLLGMSVNDPITAIYKLLTNPRSLKAALRQTWRSWQELHGEIDFDDLLAARVIYTVAPEAFAFINGHVSQIRQLTMDNTSQHAHERVERIREKLKAAWQDIGTVPWDKESVDILVDFLFPGWIKDQFYKTTVHQDVSHARPTDYWIRLNKGEVSHDDIRDQVVIHAMNDWKEEHGKAVYKGLNLPAALFQIGDFADKVEQFGLLLDGKDVRSLAEELFAIILKEGGQLRKEEHYPGFIELWRLSLDKPVEWHDQWVLDEMHKALPISLRFANELYYYWRNHDHAMVSTRGHTPALRNGFITAAKKVYIGSSDTLLKAIDPYYIYDINRFISYCSESDGGGTNFETKEWHWLLNILLAAGEKNPQVMIPQIVALVVKEQRLTEGFSYELDEVRLKEFFGEDRQKAMLLLLKEIDISRFDISDKERIQFAQQAAIKWLAVHRETGAVNAATHDS